MSFIKQYGINSLWDKNGTVEVKNKHSIEKYEIMEKREMTDF
jgi:hypothetical protein